MGFDLLPSFPRIMMMITKFLVGCAVVFLCNPNPAFAETIVCDYIKYLRGTDMWVNDKEAPDNCQVSIGHKCNYKDGQAWYTSGLHHCRACGRHVCSNALGSPRKLIVMNDNKEHNACRDCFAKAQKLNNVSNHLLKWYGPEIREEYWRQYLMHIRLGFSSIDGLWHAIEWNTPECPDQRDIIKQWDL